MVPLLAGQDRVYSTSGRNEDSPAQRVPLVSVSDSELFTPFLSVPRDMTGSSPPRRISRPRPRCGRIGQAVEEVGRIRVPREREVATRMEEEKCDTEADYFESSAAGQNDIRSQVGPLALLEILWPQET